MSQRMDRRRQCQAGMRQLLLHMLMTALAAGGLGLGMLLRIAKRTSKEKQPSPP